MFIYIYIYEGDRVDESIFFGVGYLFLVVVMKFTVALAWKGGFYFSVFGKFWIRAMLRKVLAELLPSLR